MTRASAGPSPAGPETDRELRGTVLNIQRMSTDDGPGIRTTVFLKGCSLACAWCHNPESIAPEPQLLWNEWKCIGCGRCHTVCPQRALSAGAAGIAIDRRRCTACGTCAAGCPTTALERLGRSMSVAEVLAEVVKDRAFYAHSGGGLTVSGGEPTVQAAFVGALLRGARALGIHTALDTCGLCKTPRLLELAAEADLVLYDLKVYDAARHARWTGHKNRLILDNARALGDGHGGKRPPPELWVRTPLIPGATSDPDNLSAIGRFIAAELGARVSRWQLCAFNNLCRDQYRRLGLRWAFHDTPLLTAAELGALSAVACASGVDPAIVLTSGPTRQEDAP